MYLDPFNVIGAHLSAKSSDQGGCENGHEYNANKHPDETQTSGRDRLGGLVAISRKKCNKINTR